MLEITTYNEKRALEKELTELNGRDLEKEANLQYLISKLKSKSANIFFSRIYVLFFFSFIYFLIFFF